MSQEAQLPQRNSAAAVHMYLGWLTDLLKVLMITLGGSVHRTWQNRRGCIIFLHLNALIQKVRAENGFWHEISTQGHSRSFILQSVTGTQLVAYRYNIIVCRISEVFEDLASLLRLGHHASSPESFRATSQHKLTELHLFLSVLSALSAPSVPDHSALCTTSTLTP